MELVIPANKIYNHPQSLTLDSSVMTFVGENGCGKSAILESIFKKYLIDIQLGSILTSAARDQLVNSLLPKLDRIILADRDNSCPEPANSNIKLAVVFNTLTNNPSAFQINFDLGNYHYIDLYVDNSSFILSADNDSFILVDNKAIYIV